LLRVLNYVIAKIVLNGQNLRFETLCQFTALYPPFLPFVPCGANFGAMWRFWAGGSACGNVRAGGWLFEGFRLAISPFLSPLKQQMKRGKGGKPFSPSFASNYINLNQIISTVFKTFTTN
jgi:hypothetical protein